MRHYSKISTKFWISQKSKGIKDLPIETRLVAIYLMSSPHSSMIGIYYLPIALMAHDTGISIESASCAIEQLVEAGFCQYDFDMGYVWVIEMAYQEMGSQLKETDNRIKGIEETLQSLPPLCFMEDFFTLYGKLFHLAPLSAYQSEFTLPTKEMKPPFEGASKALRSQKQIQNQNQIQEQEQEQEQEQIQKQEQNQKQVQKKNIVAPTRRDVSCETPSKELEEIFEHWKIVMHHPNAMLDSKRRKLIQNALKLGYTAEQLCNAITGCSYTPYNMGDNERGQRYDGLHVILRDADQMDRFIGNFLSPPQPPNAADKLLQSNWTASQRWLATKMQEMNDEAE